ncbi:PEP-CTERM sorting domain-containing protein [Pontiellaceae bacterium B12227]|nr:PEP-CTERM sorting domain-containing protein [Pontiellaceae bacterium B12227]
MKKTKITIASMLCAGSALAGWNYSSDFSSTSDPAWSNTTSWTESATIPGSFSADDGQLRNSSSWGAQAGWGMTNVTATTGQALIRAGWLKANPLGAENLLAGETVTMSAVVKFASFQNQNANRDMLQMGLSDASGGNVLAGVKWEGDGGANYSLELIDPAATVGNDDSGILTEADTYVTLNTAITKTTDVGVFSVKNWLSGGTEYTYAVTNSVLYADTDVFLQLRGAGRTDDMGGVSVDNFFVQTIPEPATLGLIAAFGGGILFIRRRFML